MIEKSKRKLYRHELNSLETKEQVLDELFGTWENDLRSDYVVYKYKDRNTSKKVIHRFNLLWVYPLFLLSVPFQWLFLGSVGVNRNSKIGKTVQYLCKIFPEEN